MSHVFARGADLPRAVAAEGCWITDDGGHSYLDAAGGAIVNGIGHGRREVIEAISAQLATVDYVHPTAFSSAVGEEYAHELATVVPVDDPRVYPVSGGSEATETALKLARAFHLSRGESSRTVVIGRLGSYHGNTLGALDISGRHSLRAAYLPWLGRFESGPWVHEYRCPNPHHPDRCGGWHADQLESMIERIGPARVAAFVGEAVGGASLGAAVPAPDYWPAIADVCRRHGVLLIVDEVMSGFGRTGRWFGIDHWGVRPDVIVCAKGASSGYWPLGLCIARAGVAETAMGLFTHGFTYSHHPAGAAAGLAVLRILREEGLVERSAATGRLLLDALASIESPLIGDVRGLGMMLGIEFVEDIAERRPFPRTARLAERVRAAAFGAGLLTYPVTGCADGIEGDGLMMGPPLVLSDSECDQLITRLRTALARV
jgi:adenosylmethionine-8-amino-7-oxononanoate aminotransferase